MSGGLMSSARACLMWLTLPVEPPPRVKLPDVVVCGKTGTAQNPHGKDHSWFICFAPIENPQIAMCVMVENAGFGGTVAAPIAREILDLYFHPDKEIPKNSPFDSTRFEGT
jgi:penicillin-binding protein 2